MIQLYGSARSRASRCILALEEIGVAYQHVPLRPWDDAADRETLVRLNPNARVPVLADDRVILWESMAINLYLADRYAPPPLWPGDAIARGRVYQWSVWAQTEIDVMARHRERFSGDAVRKAHAEGERLAALAILDRALAAQPYLLGDAFTLADLNVAATLSEPWESGRIDGELDAVNHGLAKLADWLARCVGRNSWDRVRSLP